MWDVTRVCEPKDAISGVWWVKTEGYLALSELKRVDSGSAVWRMTWVVRWRPCSALLVIKLLVTAFSLSVVLLWRLVFNLWLLQMLQGMMGRAMARVVAHRPLMMQVLFWFQAGACVMYTVMALVFMPAIRFAVLSVSFYQCNILLICYRRLVVAVGSVVK
jgi:hypothetical protein